jgi:hypothetical protein
VRAGLGRLVATPDATADGMARLRPAAAKASPRSSCEDERQPWRAGDSAVKE